MKKLIFLSIISIGFLLAATNLPAQTKSNVKFAKGANSATLKGSLTGYNYVDYVFGANANQTASVNLKASNENLTFEVYDAAMNDLPDSSGVKDWSGTLPADGNYTIRVMLPRSAARRKGARASFSVTISVK